MRLLRNLLWFVVGVLISACFMVPSVFAQVPDVVGPFSPYPPRYNPYLPNPATGAPSAYSQATAAGVSVAQSGTATVRTAAGVRIPVPVTQTANISKAAIAKAARFAVKGLPIAGAAFTAYDIYDQVNQSGLHTCPPPDFFCTAAEEEQAPNGSPYPSDSSWLYTSGSIRYSTPEGACTGTDSPGPGLGYTFRYVFDGSIDTQKYCSFIRLSDGHLRTWGPVNKRTGCASGHTLSGGVCTPPGYVPPQGSRPMTDTEFEQAIVTGMDQNVDYSKRMYDALKRGEGIYEGTWSGDYNPVKANTPVSVSAPPVMTSPRVVSTTQTPRTDGSVDTTTVTETTTVSPVVTGSTHGDTKITYPSQTTTTTTVTNNVTNITNTTTTVTNNLPAEEGGGSEPPEDTCAGNPTRAGCAVLGDPPPAEDIPKQDVPISITPVVFASAAGCPAPITFEAYGPRSISFEPLCDTLSGFRSLVLAIASLTASIIFMGALKL